MKAITVLMVLGSALAQPVLAADQCDFYLDVSRVPVSVVLTNQIKSGDPAPRNCFDWFKETVEGSDGKIDVMGVLTPVELLLELDLEQASETLVAVSKLKGSETLSATFEFPKADRVLVRVIQKVLPKSEPKQPKAAPESCLGQEPGQLSVDKDSLKVNVLGFLEPLAIPRTEAERLLANAEKVASGEKPFCDELGKTPTRACYTATTIDLDILGHLPALPFCTAAWKAALSARK